MEKRKKIAEILEASLTVSDLFETYIVPVLETIAEAEWFENPPEGVSLDLNDEISLIYHEYVSSHLDTDEKINFTVQRLSELLNCPQNPKDIRKHLIRLYFN